ncbi:hypothetical protein [Luteipulveratus mongoliensis]|uniref:Uncharacterized protein n=1 Tax=Luteipulveratus mongoliensis TaxID=571913 RepID=A0A0K1JDR7_9MICO|nr:hypothetical protein [Luteipulveratus mongoliensis]AKU14849.1 hypothetical protein VV02_01480 [Luteipulveratus mongoliensis]
MTRTLSASTRPRAGFGRFVSRSSDHGSPVAPVVVRESRHITGAQGCTFEQVADWAPADLLGLGVEGPSAVANRERCRRAAAILAECALYPEEFDEPPVLRLLIRHRGDMVATADDPALVEHLRGHLGVDALLVQAWQDLERFGPDPLGRPGDIGDRLTNAVNEVRVRAGLRMLTRRQVAARRLTDVVHQSPERWSPN